VDKFLELCKNFFAYSNINRGLILIIVGKQVRIPSEQELQTQLMTVLGTKMTRSISINIFGINVGSMLDESLDNTQVSSQACNMKRCPKVISSGINL